MASSRVSGSVLSDEDFESLRQHITKLLGLFDTNPKVRLHRTVHVNGKVIYAISDGSKLIKKTDLRTAAAISCNYLRIEQRAAWLWIIIIQKDPSDETDPRVATKSLVRE